MDCFAIHRLQCPKQSFNFPEPLSIQICSVLSLSGLFLHVLAMKGTNSVNVISQPFKMLQGPEYLHA